jgi:hypothetical protein
MFMPVFHCIEGAKGVKYINPQNTGGGAHGKRPGEKVIEW